MITATTGSGTTTYTYNYKNRLTNAEVDGTMVATYSCDAVGRHLGIDDSGTQTWTVFNGESDDANPYADFATCYATQRAFGIPKVTPLPGETGQQNGLKPMRNPDTIKRIWWK
jgi:hypothetical protein